VSGSGDDGIGIRGEYHLVSGNTVSNSGQYGISTRYAITNYNLIKEKYSEVKPGLREHEDKKPFIDAIEDSLKRFPDVIAAQKHWAKTDPELKRKATVAEKFDSYVINRFYDLLSLSMLYRCVKSTNNDKVEMEVLQCVRKWNEKLEKQLTYKVIPIKSLVRVQLGSALLTAEYVGKKTLINWSIV